MKTLFKTSVSTLLIVVMLISISPLTFASTSELDEVITDTAGYLYKTTKSPQIGSIGGEWAVMGLARSEYEVPDEYYQKYYETVENYVKASKGILHDRKYTEYSRLILALTSIGKDPSNVAGYNLLTPLGDYEKTIWQGINGPIWALIALDSGDYPMPQNLNAQVQAIRDMYINKILECQLPDGGWSLFRGSESEGDGTSNPDITGMALQALAKYRNKPEVEKACNEAIECMSKMQDNDGGFSNGGATNSESCIQMIVALCELGISLDDERFVKNGKTMLDNLMTFYVKGNGFLHRKDGSGSNQMVTEQAFYGLVAAQRAIKGKNNLYRMGDVLSIEKKDTSNANGIAGKHVDIPKVIMIGKTFEDIEEHNNRHAIEALASRGIINGKTKDLFDADATITRAEFAAIVVKALGLVPKANDTFEDVKSMDWFAGFVGTANTYGIVSGRSANTFDPYSTITREEAATMMAKAAELCGMDTVYGTMETRNILAQFIDYVKCNEWSMSSLAFCYDKEILDPSVMEIQPHKAIKRSEIAQMLFNMLGSAKLL